MRIRSVIGSVGAFSRQALFALDTLVTDQARRRRASYLDSESIYVANARPGSRQGWWGASHAGEKSGLGMARRPCRTPVLHACHRCQALLWARNAAERAGVCGPHTTHTDASIVASAKLWPPGAHLRGKHRKETKPAICRGRTQPQVLMRTRPSRRLHPSSATYIWDRLAAAVAGAAVRFLRQMELLRVGEAPTENRPPPTISGSQTSVAWEVARQNVYGGWVTAGVEHPNSIVVSPNSTILGLIGHRLQGSGRAAKSEASNTAHLPHPVALRPPDRPTNRSTVPRPAMEDTHALGASAGPARGFPKDDGGGRSTGARSSRRRCGGFGLTELGDGRTSVTPAPFDAIELPRDAPDQNAHAQSFPMCSSRQALSTPAFTAQPYAAPSFAAPVAAPAMMPQQYFPGARARARMRSAGRDRQDARSTRFSCVVVRLAHVGG